MQTSFGRLIYISKVGCMSSYLGLTLNLLILLFSGNLYKLLMITCCANPKPDTVKPSRSTWTWSILGMYVSPLLLKKFSYPTSSRENSIQLVHTLTSNEWQSFTSLHQLYQHAIILLLLSYFPPVLQFSKDDQHYQN